MKLSFRKNYLAMIENSARGENWLFRNFYIDEASESRDILENGGLSCAVMVSSILYLMNPVLEFSGRSKWISNTHANVASTEKDMLINGWIEIKESKKGAILTWEKKNGHGHIGFCWENDLAISNDSQKTGFPSKHSNTYSGTRKIEKIYWHPALDESF